MKRVVPALVAMLMTASTSLAAPPLTDVQLLPGDRLIGPAAGTQEQPAIAAGGGGYLVVWTDARDAITPLVAFFGGPYLTPGVGTMRDIYAARLDASGALIDATPIVVSMATLNQGFPSVAWNGQNWLVVWQHQEGLACCPNTSIYGARISPAGVVLDPSPIPIDLATSQDLLWPVVSSDGTNWLVVWRDWDMPAGIATLDGARISPAGAVLDPGGVHLRRDSWNSYPTDAGLVYAGGEYLLTWLEDSGNLSNAHWVKGQRFSPSLAPIDPAPFRIDLYSPTNALSPSVGTDGTDFFVTWFENRYYGWAQVFGARVSHAGVVRDAAGIPITGYADYTQFAPVVAWSGSNWIVAYNMDAPGTFDEDMIATRVSTTGSVLDPGGRPVKTGSGAQNTAAIAPAPNGAQIVWMDTRAGGSSPEDIYSARLSDKGTVGTEACVSVGAPAQVAPDFVWNGSQFMVVFSSLTSGTVRILAQRFDLHGSPLDAEPVQVASGPNLGAPAVAWDGTRYLVVWGDVLQSVIYGRRLAADGSAVDAGPLTLMPGNGPDVAAIADLFLVVGTYAQNPHFRYPRALRVGGADGLPIGSPVVIGSYFATQVSVGTIGNRWLVAWQENPTHDNPRADIVANFVEITGVPGTEFALTATPIPSEEDPSVAVGGNAALVAWTDNAGYQSNLAARAVLANGSIAGPSFLVNNAGHAQMEAAAAWDGTQFVVGFSDFRNDPENAQPVGDFYAARVSATYDVIDPDGFAVSNLLAVPELNPAAAGAEGFTALGGALFHPETPFAAYRIGYRMVLPDRVLAVDPPVASDRFLVSPNPSRGVVEMSCAAGAGPVTAGIYDLGGRELRNLPVSVGGNRASFSWDGRDGAGTMLSPGIYFVRVHTATGTQVAKLVRSR